MQKKYIVRLSDEERDVLKDVVKKLKGTGQKVRRAQVLLNTTPLERYPGKPRSWGRRRRFSLLDTSGLSPSTAKHRGACFASKPQAPPRWRPENLAV